MISTKNPTLKLFIVMAAVGYLAAFGALLGFGVFGSDLLAICLGTCLGAIPFGIWVILEIVHSRKYITQCLAALEYQMCPDCGWYFNEEVVCRCDENDDSVQ